MVKTAQSAAVTGLSVERGLQTTAGMRPHKLLLIDTDPKSAGRMQSGLQEAGYEVTLATDVESALDQLERSQPDLILTHTRLPDMLGFQLVEDVRKDPKWAHIPVLLLSGDLRLIEADAAGPDVEDYLVKPLDVKDVLARVQVVLRRVPRAEGKADAAADAPRSSDSLTIPRFDPLEPVTGLNPAPPQAAALPGASDPDEYVIGASAAPSDGVFRTLDYSMRGEEHGAKVTWAPKGRKRRKRTEAGRTLRGVHDDPRGAEASAAAATQAEPAQPATQSEAVPTASASEVPESAVQERSAWVVGTQDVPTLVPSAEPPPRSESDIQIKEEPDLPTRGADRPTIAVPSQSPEATIAALDAAAARSLVEGARAELGLTMVETGVPEADIQRLEARAKAAAVRAQANERRRALELQRDPPLTSAFPLLLSDLPDDAPISIVPFPSDLRLLRDPRLRAHSPFPRDPRIPSDPRAVLSQPPLMPSEPPLMPSAPPPLASAPPLPSTPPRMPSSAPRMPSAAPLTSEAPQVTDSMFVEDSPTRSKPVLPPNPRIPSNPVLPPNPRVPSHPAAARPGQSAAPAESADAAAPEGAEVTASSPAARRRKRRRARSLGFGMTVSRPLNDEFARADQATPAQGVPMPLLDQGTKRRPELNNLATVRPPPGLMLQIPMDALRSLPPAESESEDAPSPQPRARRPPIIVTLPSGATEEVYGSALPAKGSQPKLGAAQGRAESAGRIASAEPSLAAPPRAQAPARPERETFAAVQPNSGKGEAMPGDAPAAVVRVSTTWSANPPPRSELEQVQAHAPSDPTLRLPDSEAPLPSTLPPASNSGLFINIVLAVIAFGLVVLLGFMLAQRASYSPKAPAIAPAHPSGSDPHEGQSP